jgi:hypothetical protein
VNHSVHGLRIAKKGKREVEKSPVPPDSDATPEDPVNLLLSTSDPKGEAKSVAAHLGTRIDPRMDGCHLDMEGATEEDGEALRLGF